MPARCEVGQSHRGVSGGNLQAAVFSANDGLISNASLIMGIAGAADAHLVLVTGAGLLAGALSMAAVSSYRCVHNANCRTSDGPRRTQTRRISGGRSRSSR